MTNRAKVMPLSDGGDDDGGSGGGGVDSIGVDEIPAPKKNTPTLSSLKAKGVLKAPTIVEVECRMELSIDVPATADARRNLQSAIVAEIYLAEDSVNNFFAFQNGKQTLNKGTKTETAVWKWNVSFDVSADLAEITYKSADELANAIGRSLSGQDFATVAASLLSAKKVIVIPNTLLCNPIDDMIIDAPLFKPIERLASNPAMTKVRRAARKAAMIGALTNPTESYSIIQWETAAFFTYESEVGGEPIPIHAEPPPFTAMSVGISRLGASKCRSTIHWKTFDMSGKAGVNYIEQRPTQVFFDVGETHKDVIVKILPNQVFKGTMEFGLYLLEDSVQGADVGKYLHTATVKIIDTAAFPTNDLLSLVKGGDKEKVAKVPPFTLLFEFWMCCYAQPTTQRGTKKLMLLHLYRSAVAILNLLLNYYLVKVLQKAQTDEVFGDIFKGYSDPENDAAPKANVNALRIIATLLVLPFILSYYLDYRSCYWKVGGSIRLNLKSLLLKKFLNYRDDSRAVVAIEKLIMAMTRDVSTAISEVYMVGTELVFGSISKILLLIGFVLFINVNTVVGISGAAIPMAKVMIMPVLIMLWLLKLRQKPGFEKRKVQFAKEEAMINHVIKCVMNYTLIADYDRRTFMMEQYQGFVGAFNKASTDFAAFCVTSAYFAPLLTVLVVAQTIWVEGESVLSRDIELATFLASLAALRTLGGEFQNAYGLVLRMNNAYSSVSQLTVFLNLPVDVPARRIATRRRRKEGKRQRGFIREEVAAGTIKLKNEVPVDRLPIKVIDVKFTYKLETDTGPPPPSPPPPPPTATMAKLEAATVTKKKKAAAIVRHGINDLNFELDQGQLVCVLGPPGEGKSTVLRLLAYMIFPDQDCDGTIFVPPHLRAVQIQQDPSILGPDETVMDNLVYGIKQSPNTDWTALEVRCRNVLQGIGGEKAEDLLKNLTVKGYLGVDGCKVTRMSRQLIHISRALVMNPEMLIVHKPMPLLSPEVKPFVIKAFKEYCHNRGYLMSKKEPVIRRRKRTLIYTGYQAEDAEEADVVLVLQDGELTQVPKDKVATVVAQFGNVQKGVDL